MIGHIAGWAEQHPRALLLVSLAIVSGLSWAFLCAGAGMPAMSDMPDMIMVMGDWSPRYMATVFLMWTVMMTAMMLPSAAPILLVYERMPGGGVLRAGLLGSGYLAVWTAFSALATMVQWRLDTGLMLFGDMSLPRWLGGATLIAAGIYQATPMKKACLAACRNPVGFLLRHLRPGYCGAFRTGVAHGLFCLGCCWALMLLLFVGGVMNLAWIVALFALVLVEKFLPWKDASLVIGAGLALAGAILLLVPAGFPV